MTSVAAALRALADVAANSGSIRAALVVWPDRAPADLRPSLERLSARLRLGAPISHVLPDLRAQFGVESDVLAAIVRVHLSSGAPISPLLNAAADRITARMEAERRLSAALAGVKASARLIAALPFACLVLLPLDRSQLTDPTGIAVLVAGGLFAVLGLVWMRRAVPTLDALNDPIAEMEELAAAALSSGVPVLSAFELASKVPLGVHRPHVERALRLARLGSSWGSALGLTGHEPLEGLARVVGSTARTGVPLAPALVRCARSRRSRAATEVQRAMRRAPVRMLLPLALCVLPAFVLLGLGPFIRDLLRAV